MGNDLGCGHLSWGNIPPCELFAYPMRPRRVYDSRFMAHITSIVFGHSFFEHTFLSCVFIDILFFDKFFIHTSFNWIISHSSKPSKQINIVTRWSWSWCRTWLCVKCLCLQLGFSPSCHDNETYAFIALCLLPSLPC